MENKNGTCQTKRRRREFSQDPNKDAESRRQAAQRQKNCRERKKQKKVEELTGSTPETAGSTSVNTNNLISTTADVPESSSMILTTPNKDAESRRKAAERQKNCRERRKQTKIDESTVSTPTTPCSTAAADTDNHLATPADLPESTILTTPYKDAESRKKSAEHQKNYRERKKQKKIDELTVSTPETAGSTLVLPGSSSTILTTPNKDAESRRKSAERQRKYMERKKQKKVEESAVSTPTIPGLTSNDVSVLPQTSPVRPESSSMILTTPDKDTEKRKKHAESQKKSRELKKLNNTILSTPSTSLPQPSTSDMFINLVTSVPENSSCRRIIFQDEAPHATKKWQKLLARFMATIQEGPTLICSCCGGLFYKKGVKKILRDNLVKWGLNSEEIAAILYIHQDSHYLCHTCYITAKSKKVPRLSLSRGLDFPVIPEELQDMNQLEQRLVAPRLPFMQIRLTGFEQQWNLRGNVVNVESDVNMCVKSLPRTFDQSAVVQLKLMRRMQYNKPYLYDKIRPAKVTAALRHLIRTPLYVEEGVTLSKNWDAENGDDVEFNLGEEDEEIPTAAETVVDENDAIQEMNEEEEDQGADDQHTLLHIDDFASTGIKIAPAILSR